MIKKYSLKALEKAINRALLLDENHIISYREVSADITLPIDYQRLQAALETLNRV